MIEEIGGENTISNNFKIKRVGRGRPIGILFFSNKPNSKMPHRARKFQKVRAKKLVKSNKSKNFFREIAFLAVLNFFLVQKLIFGQF